MHATTRRRDRENGKYTAEPTVAATETASQFVAGNDRSYAEDQRTRMHRRRLAGFLVCIPAWALSAVPLAREIMDGRDGAGVVLVYLAVAASGLGIAAVFRGVYVLLAKRPFWSPWVFVVAAVLAIAGYTVQSAGEEIPAAGALTAELGSGG